MVASLAADGVDVRVQRAGRTGTVAVLVEPGGERTMFPDRGAAAELEAIEPAWLDGITWLHVTAYSLCTEPAGSASPRVEAVRPCRSAVGGRVSIDVSSVAVVEAFGRSRFADVLDTVAPDVVFANAAEARSLARVPPGVLVVKDGPAPGRRSRIRVGARTTSTVPAVADVVDTTGAGDAFAAGYIAAMLDGSSEVDAARAGVAVAAQVALDGRGMTSPRRRFDATWN